MKSTAYNLCIFSLLFIGTDLEDTANQKATKVRERTIHAQKIEEQIRSGMSKKDHLLTSPDRQEDENHTSWRGSKSYNPQTTSIETDREVTGFNITEMEFYDHYKNETRGHWHKLREMHQNELINLCEEVQKREKVHQRMAFYQALPRYQEYHVKMGVEGNELFVTDLLQCTVEIMNTGKQTMTPERDIFYVAEANFPGSLFKLRQVSTYRHQDKIVKIYGKTHLAYK